MKELRKASTCTSLVSANISDVMDNNDKSSISSQHDKLSILVPFTEGRYNHPLWKEQANLKFLHDCMIL